MNFSINDFIVFTISTVFGTSANHDFRNANSSQRRFQCYKLNERIIKKCEIVFFKLSNRNQHNNINFNIFKL